MSSAANGQSPFARCREGSGSTAFLPASTLPWLQGTRDHPEQRMGLGAAVGDAASELGAALGELRPQMLRLEAELALSGGDFRMLLRGGDEGRVEAVSTG